jgi:hypothetical protein
MIGVLDERLGKQSLRIDRTTGGSGHDAIEPSRLRRVGALLQDIDQSRKNVGREVHVNIGRLLVQQRHACAQTRRDLVVRQWKRMGLGRPWRVQACADERFLEIERLLQIGTRLSQSRQPTVESRHLLFLKGRHRQWILRDGYLSRPG